MVGGWDDNKETDRTRILLFHWDVKGTRISYRMAILWKPKYYRLRNMGMIQILGYHSI